MVWQRPLAAVVAPLLAVALAGIPTATEAAAPRKATVITTANDTVEGEFQGATEVGVTLAIAGQKLVVPWDSISQLSFVGRLAPNQTGNLLGLAPPNQAPNASQRLVQAPSARPDPQPAAAGRCQAITKKGAQCKRNAKAGSNYCWQHGG